MADASALCPTQGRPDLYGIGIRSAFYTQWLGAVIVEYFEEDDLPDVRFLGVFLSAASTTSLVINVASSNLETLDIYIMLLLSIGMFFFLIPLHVWRIITRCNPNLDPFRISKERHGLVYQVSTIALLLANSSVAIWFYTTYLPKLNQTCRQYAFVFGKTDIKDKRYIVFTAFFYISVLVIGVMTLFFRACCMRAEVDYGHWSRVRRTHLSLLHEARTLCGLGVFAVLVAAIELVINWNQIDGISDFTTSAQLIPFFLSLGMVLRVWVLRQVTGSGPLPSESSSGGSGRSHDRSQEMENAEIYDDVPYPTRTYHRG